MCIFVNLKISDPDGCLSVQNLLSLRATRGIRHHLYLVSFTIYFRIMYILSPLLNCKLEGILTECNFLNACLHSRK